MGMEEKEITEKENNKAITWATFCHVGALSLYLGIPFGHIIIPLVLWLIKKNEYPFVDEQGKESLNFQISMSIYALVAGLLTFALVGFLVFPILIVVHVVFIITAIVKTNKGENYRYPITIRIIK
jgi:uncharacterized Tic20 family protein